MTRSSKIVAVDYFMAMSTQSDQVPFRIIAQVTAELDVVDLELLHTPAVLTPPVIPIKNLTAQFLIGIGI